jgi:hypothetical protein
MKPNNKNERNLKKSFLHTNYTAHIVHIHSIRIFETMGDEQTASLEQKYLWKLQLQDETIQDFVDFKLLDVLKLRVHAYV